MNRLRQQRLTRRGWAFLVAAMVALIGAYAVDFRELLYVGVFLGALPLLSLLMVWLRKPRLSVSRSFIPHILEAGSTAGVSLVVRNLSTGRSRRSTWSDELAWRPGATPAADLPALQPRGARYAGRGNTTTVRYELRPPRRGVFPVGPFTVDLTDALGLATSVQRVGVSQPIVVTPEVVGLPDSGLANSSGDGEARVIQRKAAGDEDDAMTREYRSGDAMRRVHWRASARHGDLMVRQEEQRSLPEARVIVDTRRAGYRDAQGDQADDDADSPAFEWVVRMLASVTVHLRRAGYVVDLVETGTAQLTSLGQRRQRTWGDEEFLVGLAGIGLADGPLAVASSGRGPVTGPLIAVVGTPDAPTLDWLARQRRPGELAVMFMVQGVTSVDVISRQFGIATSLAGNGEQLIDAGWVVVPVRADDDHAAAWAAVVAETGRSRAGA